ncbi:MAG TPA: glycogen debranching enzyme GlgX, partial [Gammaproteobacteria bacterium]|nr:glycogen debranching enzyme GlgX [Gammaproteobacteria bacterium]
NNNAYCQDNDISWVDWKAIDVKARGDIGFVRRLLRLRQRHPALRWPRFLHGHAQCEQGVKDITWIAPDGAEMSEERWRDPNARAIGLLLNGKAGQSLAAAAPPPDEILLLLLNAHPDGLTFKLPALPFGLGWVELLAADRRPQTALHEFNEEIQLEGRSVVLYHLAVEE